MFSSKSFVVSGLTFRSLIHFDFYPFNPLFLCMVLESVPFHSFTCSRSVFPAPFIEGAVFAPLNIPASFDPCFTYIPLLGQSGMQE